MNALRFVQARLQELQVQYRQLATDKVERRVARALLRLVEVFGRPAPQNAIRLDIKLSQQQLGCLVGVSRESINKLLNEWQRSGVIAMDGGYITVRDRDALDEIGNAYE